MSILLHKPYFVKWSIKGKGVKYVDGTTGKNGFIKNVNKTRPISVLSVHTLSDFNFLE